MKDFENIVEEGLKRQPDFKLGADFKDRVARMILKKERSSQRKFYLMVVCGVVFMFGAAIGFLASVADMSAFAEVGKMAPLAVLIGVLVAVIQYLDKRLVKDKYFKQLA